MNFESDETQTKKQTLIPMAITEARKEIKESNNKRYPTHLLQLEECCALTTGPLNTDDHRFEWPQGAKAQKRNKEK